ncbi:MAG: hypothetical protein JKY94_17345 [Rhodobacteraceae bacterium]|nr:hypothetical protein [Paracoccaceae bacterium]
MDPEATKELIYDRELPIGERLVAVFDLQEWRRKGGYLPQDYTDAEIEEDGAMLWIASLALGAEHVGAIPLALTDKA